jgi:hypothetical protein
MTAVQLALCEPTWDPEPDDEDDDGPWCNTRTPTQHDLRRAELADLHDQGAGPYALRTATTVPTGSYL